MFSEDDLLPLSALQHLLFCERRAALVHIEGLWGDNVFTLEGSHLHEKVDLPGQTAESRRDVRIARGVPLRSFRLGLSGKADVVEFHRAQDSVAGAVALDGAPGRWVAFPVEYKRGRLRKEEGYEIQLCAQALCLEEMLGAVVPAGAIYYGETRRRLDIVFDDRLRADTERAAARLHELIESRITPKARKEPKCERCSLLDQCHPEMFTRATPVEDYLRSVLPARRSENPP